LISNLSLLFSKLKQNAVTPAYLECIIYFLPNFAAIHFKLILCLTYFLVFHYTSYNYYRIKQYIFIYEFIETSHFSFVTTPLIQFSPLIYYSNIIKVTESDTMFYMFLPVLLLLLVLSTYLTFSLYVTGWVYIHDYCWCFLFLSILTYDHYKTLPVIYLSQLNAFMPHSQNTLCTIFCLQVYPFCYLPIKNNILHHVLMLI